MSLINLCPHPISFTAVVEGQPALVTLPPESPPARVETEAHVLGTVDGVPVQMQTYGEVKNLPPYDHMSDTSYVVSGIVLSALRIAGCTRPDILAPATGPRDNAMRDSQGQVVGVTKFNVLGMRS